MTNRSRGFYSAIGPYLSRRDIVAELGGPIWDDDRKEWFIARDGDSVVGFGAVIRESTAARLCSAYVIPSYRKQGVYRALVQARLAACDGDVKCVATDASAPTLARFGFVETWRTANYRKMRMSR